MSKKKPRSRDPHSWIKDTTKKAVGPGPSEEPGEEAPAAEPEEAEADDAGRRRYVFVEYDAGDGRIIAMHEETEEGQGQIDAVSARTSEGRAAARITLTGKLLDESLVDLHDNYKVDASKKKPALVPNS